MGFAGRCPIRHVIFDFDGTLADTGLLTEQAVRSLAPRFGLPALPLAAIRACIGYANPEFYTHLYPDQPAELVYRLGKEIEKEEQRLMPAFREQILFAGCRGMLSALDAAGIGLYIASTGDPEHVFPLVELAGVRARFREILCGEPDKAGMVGRLAGAYGAEGWLMVGDMHKDVTAAHANGIPAVGACFGYCVRGRAEFDCYVDSPDQLTSLVLDGWKKEE